MNDKTDGIIFDMDGVLVTNDSYNQAIINTVNFMLKRERKSIKTDLEDINAMKKITGFNNDWDVSFALVKLLGKRVETKEFKKEVKLITPAIRKTVNYKYVKDVFQSFYRGKVIFKKVYKRNALFNINEGLIETETMLLDINILKNLSLKYKLAIATSRPRFEAIYAANFQKISPGIILEENIIAKEDCKREKPFPDPLMEAKKRMSVNNPIYVGDTINDVIAAKKAGMECMYVGKEKIGDYQINDVNNLKEIFL